MQFLVKLIPQLIAWTLMVILFLRGNPGRGRGALLPIASGFVLGSVGYVLLARLLPGAMPLNVIRNTVGAGFFALWGVAVTALYRSTVRDFPLLRVERFLETSWCARGGAILTGVIAGGISASLLNGLDNSSLQLAGVALLALAGVLLAGVARPVERRLVPSVEVTPSSLLAALIALLLFSSSSSILLDLFSPLSMKVMKGTHDFVHQFMESVLIPDHIFIRPVIWGYIGFLFGKEVGFWGGMIIWFTPTLLIALAISLEPLPSVAHIRQGAQRRRVLADAIRMKRLRLVVPAVSLVALAAAAYRSSFPGVEYWDPKPLPVVATPAGEIVIPRKGEVDIEDGKLHKYLYKQSGKEVRFFVLMNSDGKLTVDLDACAICKPDGYGQTEGMVLCYYCKTLIPLDTVGRPGGCNPVPIPFQERADGVHLDALTLFNNWNQTVQTTMRSTGGEK